MKITIIVNYILLIFIIHLILININISKIIKFENNNLTIHDYIEEYVPNFSQDDTEPEYVVQPSPDTNISHKDQLLKFINSNETAPSNYYSSDDNSSNFKSNVLPVDKFYKINKDVTQKVPDYDDLNLNDSKYSDFNPSCANYSTSINDLRMGHHNK